MFDFDWILVSGQDKLMVEEFSAFQYQRLEQKKRFASKDDPTFLPSKESILTGYKGEWAASRWLEIEMDFTTDAKQAMFGDLDFGIEVKATTNPSGNLWCSLKTLNDYIRRSPNTPVICAKVAYWPWVELPGWLYAKEIKKFPFTKTHERHNNGFLVPLKNLRPMSDLKKLCEHWKKTLN